MFTFNKMLHLIKICELSLKSLQQIFTNEGNEVIKRRQDRQNKILFTVHHIPDQCHYTFQYQGIKEPLGAKT